MKRYCWIIFLVLMLPLAAPYAQDNSACLSCHGNSDLKRIDSNGHEVTLTVLQTSLDSSVHADKACIDCHKDLAGVTDFPHKENIEKVQCETCHHDMQDHARKSNRRRGIPVDPNTLTCVSCHGKHNISSQEDPVIHFVWAGVVLVLLGGIIIIIRKRKNARMKTV